MRKSKVRQDKIREVEMRATHGVDELNGVTWFVYWYLVMSRTVLHCTHLDVVNRTGPDGKSRSSNRIVGALRHRSGQSAVRVG